MAASYGPGVTRPAEAAFGGKVTQYPVPTLCSQRDRHADLSGGVTLARHDWPTLGRSEGENGLFCLLFVRGRGEREREEEGER